ncbi:transposase [Streptomyces sp. 8N616]|uniref:transposase n=1 Tax=Streptomyces sp. 8N616 TaxID=3457414 RepID=UPI003FD6B058
MLILEGCGHACQRKYPPELIERAVRMVAEKQRETQGRPGIIREVGDLLGIHPQALRHWVKKDEARRDPQAAAACRESERIRQLEKENAELRRANDILKAAAAFFAAGLDPRPPR